MLKVLNLKHPDTATTTKIAFDFFFLLKEVSFFLFTLNKKLPKLKVKVKLFRMMIRLSGKGKFS